MKTLVTGTAVGALLLFGNISIGEQSYLAFSEAEAKSFSRSSSFSSSRSWSRSSGNRSSSSLWNRSSSSRATIATTPKTKTTSGGYIKSNSKSNTSSGKSGKSFTSNRKSANAIAASSGSKSFKRFKTESGKFSKPAKNITSTNKSFSNNSIYKKAPRVSYDRYYSNRDTFYQGRRWTAPNYAYVSQPSFGMWDAMFMWYILDTINDSSSRDTYYHHRDSEGMREWRAEADRLAKDNKDLQEQLAKLDAEMNSLEKQGVQVNPDFVPAGVDSTVMMSAAAATGAYDRGLRMGTGGKLGNYYAFCNILKGNVNNLEIDCQNTNGSVDNLNGLISGKYDAIVVQSDVYNEWQRENPGVNIDGLQATLYPEPVFMIVNENAGVESIKDINYGKHRIYSAGSGTTKTLVGFANQDSNYQALVANSVQVDASENALEMVASNPNGVMFYVCGMKCGLIDIADKNYGDRLNLAAVDDWNFNDASDQYGNSIYSFVEIPEIYKNLQPGGLFSSGDIETLTVTAVLIVSKDWVNNKGTELLSNLEIGLWPSLDQIQKRVGVPE